MKRFPVSSFQFPVKAKALVSVASVSASLQTGNWKLETHGARSAP
jgi:hypothetical protein